MLSGIQLWFYGTDHMFLSRQSTTTSFESTPIDPIAPLLLQCRKTGQILAIQARYQDQEGTVMPTM